MLGRYAASVGEPVRVSRHPSMADPIKISPSQHHTPDLDGSPVHEALRSDEVDDDKGVAGLDRGASIV